MHLISQSNHFTWSDLSVDKAAKEKRYRFQKSKSNIFVPTKAVLSIKWDIDAGAGNFQVLSATGAITNITNSVALSFVDYSDGSENSAPITLQAGIGSGAKMFLIVPTTTSAFGKLLFDSIHLAISPAADQNVGWITGHISMFSE